MKEKSGFSLIELIGVLALIGFTVVVAMTLMNNSTVSQAGFTSLINTFLADFNQVKNLAASENRYYAVVFDAIGTSYDIRRQRDITDFSAAGFDTIRTVIPLERKGEAQENYRGVFFRNLGGADDVESFSVNSRGEIHTFPPVVNAMPTERHIVFWVSREAHGQGEILRQNRISIYPFGGYRVTKEIPR